MWLCRGLLFSFGFGPRSARFPFSPCHRSCSVTDFVGSYQVASPVIERSKPLLESADNLAVATFNRAEATFPCEYSVILSSR